MTTLHVNDETLKELATTIILNLEQAMPRLENLVYWLIDSSYEGYTTTSLDDIFLILTGKEAV